MQKVILTIGHKVGAVETHTTESICTAVTELMPVDGYTAIPCMGMWRGVPEASTRVEFVCESDEAAAILLLVPQLAANLRQEAIMVEVAAADVSFPTALVNAA